MAKNKVDIAAARASLKFLRVAPRKVRLVADLIRGKRVADAEQILKFTLKPAVVPHLDRLLKSAIANAKQNSISNTDDLLVGDIQVDSGPMMKRWQPRAYGRASKIRKRMSHVRLTLTEQ